MAELWGKTSQNGPKKAFFDLNVLLKAVESRGVGVRERERERGREREKERERERERGIERGRNLVPETENDLPGQRPRDPSLENSVPEYDLPKPQI